MRMGYTRFVWYSHYIFKLIKSSSYYYGLSPYNELSGYTLGG